MANTSSIRVRKEISGIERKPMTVTPYRRSRFASVRNSSGGQRFSLGQPASHLSKKPVFWLRRRRPNVMFPQLETKASIIVMRCKSCGSVLQLSPTGKALTLTSELRPIYCFRFSHCGWMHEYVRAELFKMSIDTQVTGIITL